MDAAPEIVAVSAAREVKDHARAIEALSDKPMSVRFGYALLCGSVGFIAMGLRKLVGIDVQPEVFAAFAFVVLFGILAGIEIYYLRRRVTAITYLLLEQERKNNRP
jgi:hypothetical protein